MRVCRGLRTENALSLVPCSQSQTLRHTDSHTHTQMTTASLTQSSQSTAKQPSIVAVRIYT